MVISSLSSVMIIFVGQNYSNHQYSRIQRALTHARNFSLLWGGFVFLLLLLFAGTVASIFTKDAQVIAIARQYFLIIAGSYGFQGLVTLSTSVYNGLNKPYPSIFFIAVRTFGLFVPLAWAGSRLIGLTGVMWAGFTANILVGIAAFMYLRRMVTQISISHMPQARSSSTKATEQSNNAS